MASINITIPDQHTSRVTYALNKLYPESTIEQVIKQHIKALVLGVERQEAELTALDNIVVENLDI